MRTLVELVLSNAAIATVLALVAAVASRNCRRPQVVYALWLLVLLKLVTPPLVRIPVSILPNEAEASPIASISSGGIEQQSILSSVRDRERPGLDVGSGIASSLSGEHEHIFALHDDAVVTIDSIAQGASTAIGADDRHTLGDRVDVFRNAPANLDAVLSKNSSPWPRSIRWSELLLSVWVLGGIAWLAVVVYRLHRFRREISRTRPVDSELQLLAHDLAVRMGLRRAPVVRLVNAVVPPMLWAICRPAEILLPRPLVARLSPEQQAALLAHELAHYYRCDHLVRWFEVVVIGVYWWHPVAWIARRELQRAAEQCCDACVLLALPGRECDYARVILETIDFLAAYRRPAPMLASGLGPIHQLERRFAMILHARPMRGLPVVAKMSLLLLGLLVLPLSTMAQPGDEPARPALPVVVAQPAGEDIPAVEAAAPAAAEPVLAPSIGPLPVAIEAVPADRPDGGGSIEKRLQRLEKLVESLVAEMKNQRTAPRAANSYRAAMEYGITGYPTQRVRTLPDTRGTLSLSELKKHRIDIEDQLEELKDKLAEIDDRIAKLQSARSSQQRYPDTKK
jgi:beta-lactamase regulating signal transducer with metallopeptidase domain